MYEYWLLRDTQERIRMVNEDMARIRLAQSVIQRRRPLFSLRLPVFGLTFNRSKKGENYVNTCDTALAHD